LFGKQGRARPSPLWLLSGGRSSLGKCHAAVQFDSIGLPGGRKNGGNIAKRLRRGCKKKKKRKREKEGI
jgi:hypothetical protein